MSGEAELRLSLAARVVNREGEPIGRLNEVVVEIESRRIAGFHIMSDEVVPRELFVMAGQVAEFDAEQLTLDLSDEEFVALPDARQQLFVAPDQDLDAEIADAESGNASAGRPDPDERPVPTGLPGIALTANLLIPMAIERSIMDDEQIALRDGMRILSGDGEEIGNLGGVVIDHEARLLALALGDESGETIDYRLIGTIDDDANELALLNDEQIAAEEDETPEAIAPAPQG
jgi:sporulation protein YlmC with PRC-barrel domain